MGTWRHKVVWHLRTYLPGEQPERQHQHRRQGGQRQPWVNCHLPVAVWTVVSTRGHLDSQGRHFKMPEDIPWSLSEVIGVDSRKIWRPVRYANGDESTKVCININMTPFEPTVCWGLGKIPSELNCYDILPGRHRLSGSEMWLISTCPRWIWKKR